MENTAHHTAALSVLQGRDARYSNHALTVGGKLVRNDVGVRLDASGADAQLLGLFVADGVQHHDSHTLIDHAKPHGSSREVYKGILSGSARGVFHGSILVRKDAQKTDAHQSNKNLLLSKDALVNSTPQLEILADDVKCSHGGSVGQLRPDQLFYLRSRGVTEAHARALLTWAFAAEMVQRVGPEELRGRVRRAVTSRLPSGELLREVA